MSMIKVEKLTFSYPGSYDAVFKNVSFQLDTDWRLGFVGRNGRGKTTFLNLLLGKYEYRGRILSSVNFSYFPYEVQKPERLTGDILAQLCPCAEEWELIRELSYLKVKPEILERPFSVLSDGERTKTLLAALFLDEDKFPLIDEPTNHLDALGRAAAAEYLKGKRGYILVSHDRAFLDGCVDHILSINKNNIEVQSGNFSSWKENFDRINAFEHTKNDSIKKEISRLEKSAGRTSDWAEKTEAGKHSRTSGLRPDRGYIGHKSAKMMKRSKAVQERQRQMIEEKSGLLKNVEQYDNLKISPLGHHAGTLVSVNDVKISYDGKEVCGPLNFEISSGERIALCGGNGSGKSSIIKLILGENIPHTGTVTAASGLVISYLPQDTSFLCGTLDEYAKECGIDKSRFKTILRKLDFERVQFDKRMEDFSGGQKKKVLIAKSLCESAHLYIWDEPLNFIDIYSRIQLERLISEFSITMLFVEHDRTFCENTATKTVEL